MENKQARELLFEELEKNVPNRDVCRVATKEQIERIMADVNAKIEEKQLQKERFEVTAANLPREIVFEMVLYVLSTTEWVDDEYNISYADENFWNLEDKATSIFVNGIKKVFGMAKSEELTRLKLEDFLAYAKSDAPGL